MAITESALAVYSTLDRTPPFRLEYRDDSRRRPANSERLAHVYVLGLEHEQLFERIRRR
jgi:hypothetical protein